MTLPVAAPSGPPARSARVVIALGTAQMLAWGSSYYLPAMLAAPMAREFGISTALVYAAFSLALIVSAAVGPAAGRVIDRWGGRPVLAASSLLFAAGLAAMGVATGPAGLFAAWVVMGVGIACGLYEAAFSALVRLYGHDARGAITGITLLGGLASTVSWPLTALLDAELGWRGACFCWAVLHLLLGLPLNLSLPRGRTVGGAFMDSARAGTLVPLAADVAEAGPAPTAQPRRAAVLLAFVFAGTWFISTAMAAHLPQLLQAMGMSLAVAVGIGALVGPAQVAGRLLEFGVLRRVHPLLSARLAAVAHPLGVLALLLAGTPAAALFAILHGAGNGILTIAKGTLPLLYFGAQGYGARQGWLTLPAKLAQAAAPFLFGLWLERWGAGALGLSGALGFLIFAALFVLPALQGPAARRD